MRTVARRPRATDDCFLTRAGAVRAGQGGITASTEQDLGLSPGAIAGVATGGVVLFAVGSYLQWKQKRDKRRRKEAAAAIARCVGRLVGTHARDSCFGWTFTGQ